MQATSIRDENAVSRLCYIIEAALEYFISLLVTGAYLARITGALGFSDSLTGILSSFVSLGCVFQLSSIRLFRNQKSVKRIIIICHIVNQLFFALVYLTPILPLTGTQKTLIFFICFCTAYIISNLIAPPKVTWLMGLVPDHTRGIFTARKEIISLLGGMIFTYIMGNIIDMLDAAGSQRLSFIAGGITVFMLMLLHTLSLLPVKEYPSTASAAPARLRDLIRNRMYVRIVPVIIVWHIASSSATPYYGAYQIKELGFSMTFVSVLSIAYSLIRAAASPVIGKYADRTSFSRMVTLCLSIAAAAFLINSFTVPSNGRIFYTVYYCLYAVSMAGINSAMTNLVYDCVQGDNRRSALAISTALGGVSGFAATCLMSPIVDAIQRAGNRLGTLTLYPAQFVSAVACAITLLLIVYLRTVVIPAEKQAKLN